MRKTLRIFISSPGDVPEERLRAHLVVQKLARDYQRFFKIEPYLWEYEPMLASGHFQDAIEPPSSSDIMVLVVYSRLGTPLPERTALREYRGIDGRAPVTGTEWEFEDALEANRDRGAPDLLAYRKLGDPQASLADAGKRAEQERQWQSLEAFWQRHFEGSGVFLAGSAKFGSLEEFDAKLESDLIRLIEARVAKGLQELAGAEDEATWLQGSPFPGLASYEFRDAPVFFGRDEQIREASTRLQAAAEHGTAFLLILGASGSGKSSLARAGLLPALFAAKAVPGVGLWRRVILRPGEGGEDPVLGLAKALLAGNPAQGEGLPELDLSKMGAEALAAHLQAAPDDPSFPFRQALAAVAHEARRRQGLLPHEEARLVLLVDQVEELFTRELDPERRALFVRILAGLARSGVVWVVATVRNDLWHRAAGVPALVELVEAGARLDLPAPGGAEIFEIVRRPAAAAGLVFEKDHESGVGLDAVIARAAAEEPGALPLLSVMMRSLYERDVVEGRGQALTFAGYRALGELRGAIAQRADRTLEALKAQDPEAAAALPRLLRALVTASGDGTATSRPARLDGFAPNGPEGRLVAALLEDRLLVASEREGVAEVRIAHEALLENWPAAREQIAIDRRDLQTRARLETLQRRWQDAASPAERKTALLTSLNLAEGQDLVRRWEIPAGSGLGAFVGQSQAAESWRRRRFAVAAGILAAIFAGIAALASLQWRRAEEQTVMARAAEGTQREARRAADEARSDAERERDRADSEKGRALAALREAKRNTARTLSAQAEAAAGRAEVVRALEYAIEAGETEADVRAPGERSTSLPALLRALADKRELLHIQRTKAGGGHWLPHDFYGDDALAYADIDSGIMLADLSNGRVRRLAPIPPETLPMNVRGVQSLGLVAVASVKNLFVVEAEAGKVRAQIGFEDRLSALEVSESGRVAAVGSGHAITFVDLDKPERQALVSVPSPRPDYLVGQIRFLPGARRVLVTYGAEIREYDRDAGTWSAPLAGDLSAESVGLSRDLVDKISAQGIVVLTEMRPDAARKRILTYSPLHLSSLRADGSRYEYDREPLESVLGLGFGLADNAGDILAVTGIRSEAGYEMRLSFVSEEKKPLRFDTFRVSASDLANEQIQGCRTTRSARFLACHYNGKTAQGIHVWHVIGGKHRDARLASAILNSSSAAILPDARLLAGERGGLKLLPGGRAAEGAVLWDETWRLGAAAGEHVAATSTKEGKVQVLRTEGDAVRAVLPPREGKSVVVRAGSDRALVMQDDRLVVHELSTGRELFAIPALTRLVGAAVADNGKEIIAITRDAVYAFDDGGRLKGSWPVRVTSGEGAVAIDADRRVVAFSGPDAPQRLDLATGAVRPIAPSLGNVVAIHIGLALDRDRIVIALEGGRVVSVDDAGREIWSLNPASDETFEVSAMPGQKPHGTVMQLSLSEGGRVAILRQDVPSIDLHDLGTGQMLTQLTPPWAIGVPARVSFDREDRVASSWALHILTADRPSAVSLHAPPLTDAGALEAAKKALAAIAPRLPDGSPRPAKTTN